MTTTIANGELTTEHSASSYGQPVFLFNGIAHGPADAVDLGESALDFLRYPVAAELVQSAYFRNTAKFIDEGSYNLIAKFTGLPLSHGA